METNKTSWHSVSHVVDYRPRCCVSNYYFSKYLDDTEYFHVMSFDGRPDEPVKHVVGILDNALRNVVSRTLGGRAWERRDNPKGDVLPALKTRGNH